MKRVGVIGLGVMGRPMALRLVEAGYRVVAHSRSPGPVDELVSAGATRAETPKAVAEQVDCVLTVLPDSPDVRLVALGPDGIRGGAHEGLVVVDMSTISPLVTREIAEALEATGVKMMDAPISGGEKGAVEGTLSIMVGGDQETFESVRPVFDVLGKTITHVGPVGAGGFTKLANQTLLGAIVSGLAEALTLARRAGLDMETTMKALSGGSAGNRFLDLKASNYLKREFKPGFAADLHDKDIGLVLESAKALGTPLPVTAVVQQLFTSMCANGMGRLDNSAMLLLTERLAGLESEGER